LHIRLYSVECQHFCCIAHRRVFGRKHNLSDLVTLHTNISTHWGISQNIWVYSVSPRHSNLVAPKRKCRASQLPQFVDGTRKSMFMGFRTEQSYGQVQRELKKKNWVVAGNTNVLFNSNDSNLQKTRHV